MRLARERSAALVTTDFNLQQVASLQGVAVLNVALLANALRPSLAPGDTLHTEVVQPAGSRGRGSASWKTAMVVVEGGRHLVGARVTVEVTRVLPTAGADRLRAPRGRPCGGGRSGACERGAQRGGAVSEASGSSRRAGGALGGRGVKPTGRVGAIVVGAGAGRRVGGVEKAFLEVAGRPLLCWSVEVFERAPEVDEICLVVAGSSVERAQRLVREWGWPKVRAVVAGGRERQESVAAGLAPLLGCEWVLVHDAARPW